MHARPERVEALDRAADIHGVAAEPVELGHDQDVIPLEPVEEADEASALISGDAARDCLGDHAL